MMLSSHFSRLWLVVTLQLMPARRPIVNIHLLNDLYSVMVRALSSRLFHGEYETLRGDDRVAEGMDL